MGGFGSRRPAQASLTTKRTTDELPALDVRELKRRNLIHPGQEKLIPFTEGVEPVRLVWVPCGFGAGSVLRPWFICPGEECGRRVAILYLEGGRLLLCRHCLDLAYPSQRESTLLRAKRKADKARARLGPDKNPRPKGMHFSTFVRLANEYVKARREHTALYNAWSAKVSEQLFKRSDP